MPIATQRTLRVAVIGAGIAGLSCAARLAEAECEVRLFDKGRRLGGRMNTRRVDGFQFDHGAQYLTARDPHFNQALRGWHADGVVGPWAARVIASDWPDAQGGEGVGWVGVGSNRRLPEHLARGLDVRLETRVSPLPLPDAGKHALLDDLGRCLGSYDAVVVTAPLIQAAALLEAYPALVGQSGRGSHGPCWVVMVAFEGPVPVDIDVIDCAHDDLSWAARDASKPDRPHAETWVLHGSPGFSRAHLECPPEEVAERLLARLAARVHELPRVLLSVAHRWRFAHVERPVGTPVLCDPACRVVIAGDGLLGPGLEAAWLSGRAAADAVTRRG